MLLKVCDVAFSYDSIDVLKNITFEAEKKRIIGVLGPNGAGKTTLLKCIFRVLTPKRGVIFLDGKDIRTLSRIELARKISVVTQENINVPFTVLETILMGRYPHTSPLKLFDQDASTYIEDVIEKLSLREFLERRLDEVSGGERRRIHIARALIQQPEVLLLDEPTSHLDPNYKLQIMSIVKEFTVKNDLVTIVTLHDLSLAARFCDKIILLKNGKIFAAGTPSEVLTPKNIGEIYKIDVKIIEGENGEILGIIPLKTI
ncbi:hypothetical protein DRN46_06450 [Thermococci archaeon]|nr:MAG: hypothetical protein DRN46_06450 [Thermococci archaeon]RLF94890.1 MAG: hypothetical protein DRN52_04545 [Thermococci archaeon]